MVYRIVLMLFFIAGGYIIGVQRGFSYEGILWGAGIGILAIIFDLINIRMGIGALLGSLAGLLIGITFAKFLYYPLKGILNETQGLYASLVLNVLFGYGGLFYGLRKGKDISLSDIIKVFKGGIREEPPKVIDTSVIIDGRIADVCDSGFLEGTFIIPQFILQELQYIADSSDSLKRARGRRGLDVLHRIQKMSNVTVKIVDEDFPNIKEVDAKLVALARMHGGKIVTNDFNLNKVAQLQGVAVLNLNELANALKPVVLPGEGMNIFIVKEGKEFNQGVGYLDDGTMVVVDNARRLINHRVDVVVTSVLQTTAGRMIFARLKEEAEKEELKLARH